MRQVITFKSTHTPILRALDLQSSKNFMTVCLAVIVTYPRRWTPFLSLRGYRAFLLRIKISQLCTLHRINSHLYRLSRFMSMKSSRIHLPCDSAFKLYSDRKENLYNPSGLSPIFLSPLVLPGTSSPVGTSRSDIIEKIRRHANSPLGRITTFERLLPVLFTQDSDSLRHNYHKS